VALFLVFIVVDDFAEASLFLLGDIAE